MATFPKKNKGSKTPHKSSLNFVKVVDVNAIMAISRKEAAEINKKLNIISYRYKDAIYLCNREVANMKEFYAMVGETPPAPETPADYIFTVIA